MKGLGSEPSKKSSGGDYLPRNAKGGVCVKMENIKPAWKFVADSLTESCEPDPHTECPEKLPLKGMTQVMKALHPRTTLKEAAWIYNVPVAQEEITLSSAYDHMKENADERVDPVAEAFRMICKDTSKGSYVDVARVCDVYKKLGLGGIDEKFVQEVIDTVVNELPENTKRKTRRKIDLPTFRKLCCFPPDVVDEEFDQGHASGSLAADLLGLGSLAEGAGALFTTAAAGLNTAAAVGLNTATAGFSTAANAGLSTAAAPISFARDSVGHVARRTNAAVDNVASL